MPTAATARQNNLPRALHSWTNDRSGTIALMAAFVIPVLLTLTISSIDYMMVLRQKSYLQRVIDHATLAAANELSLADAKEENVKAAVKAVVENFFDAGYNASAGPSGNGPVPTLTVSVSTSPLRVNVTATQSFDSVFGKMFGLGVDTITASAVAQVIGKPNLCILALNQSANGTISLEKQALVTGNNCAVFSNSKHNIGIKTKNSARLTASTICSAGGVQGGGKHFNPLPIMDCPQFDDPLAGRPEPVHGHCDPLLPKVVASSRTLYPGVYCGLTITSGAIVDLEPGVYVFDNGPLVVTSGATLRGKDVGLYFTSDSVFRFDAASEVNLEAPTSGPMAGLLIFTSRSQSTGMTHDIFSRNAQNLVGTIYMPTSRLRVDGDAQIGGDSAYTALVVNKLQLFGGPHVVLNTNYSATDVPVPDGIKGAGQPVRIIQ